MDFGKVECIFQALLQISETSESGALANWLLAIASTYNI